MSYQPNKWATGLVPLAVLWVLGTVGAQNDTGKALSTKVRGMLGDDVENASVKASGRDVALFGQAFTHANLQTAVDKALAAPGVRSVDSSGLGVIPAVAPYTWWMVRDGGRVTLSGSVPNPGAKASLVADAKGLGLADVLDRTVYGRGESAALPAAAAYAAQVLAQFSRGAATYTDGALDVSGVAASADGYEKAKALLKSPPAGVKLATSDLTPPVAAPYVFAASREGDKLTLSGGAATEAARDALAKLGAQLFPGARIENKLAIQSGAPGGAAQAAGWALGALSRLASGKAEVRDSAITLAGKASGPGDIEDVTALAANAPPSFTLKADEIAPAVVDNFSFAVQRDEEGLHFTGYTPDAAARQAMLAAGAATGAQVEDHTRIAAGLDKGVDFNAVVKFALDELSGLEQGKVKLAGTELSVTGRTLDWRIGQEAQERLKSLPAGLTLADSDIQRPETPDEIAVVRAEKKKAAEEAEARAAEDARQAEEMRKSVEAAKAEEAAKEVEAAKAAEQVRVAVEKGAERARVAEDVRKVEAARQAEAAKAAEQAKAIGEATAAAAEARRALDEAKRRVQAMEARIAEIEGRAKESAQAAEAARQSVAQSLAALEAQRKLDAARQADLAQKADDAAKAIDAAKSAAISALEMQVGKAEQAATVAGDAAKSAQDTGAKVTSDLTIQAKTAQLDLMSVEQSHRDELAHRVEAVTKAVEGALAQIKTEVAKVEEVGKQANEALAAAGAARSAEEARLADLAKQAKDSANSAAAAAQAIDDAKLAASKIGQAAEKAAVDDQARQTQFADQVGKAEAAAKSAAQSASAAVDAARKVAEPAIAPPAPQKAPEAPTVDVAALAVQAGKVDDAAKAAAASAAAAEAAARNAEAAAQAADEARLAAQQPVDTRPLTEQAGKAADAAKAAAASALAAAASARAVEDAANAASQSAATAKTAQDATSGVADAAKKAEDAASAASQSAAAAKTAQDATSGVADSAKKAEDAAAQSASAAQSAQEETSGVADAAKKAQDAANAAAQSAAAAGQAVKAAQEAASGMAAALKKTQDLANAASHSEEAADQAGKLALTAVTGQVSNAVSSAKKAEDAASAAAQSATSADQSVKSAEVAVKRAAEIADAAKKAQDAAAQSAASADKAAKAAEDAAKAQTAQAPSPKAETPQPKMDENAPPTLADIEATTPLERPKCEKYMLFLLNHSSVQFALGRASVAAASQPLLTKLAKVAQRCPEAKLEVAGYTDNIGDANSNKRLSKARADSVMAALTRDGVAADRLTAIGYGMENPIASNDTDEGQAKNRRIEIHVK